MVYFQKFVKVTVSKRIPKLLQILLIHWMRTQMYVIFRCEDLDIPFIDIMHTDFPIKWKRRKKYEIGNVELVKLILKY